MSVAMSAALPRELTADRDVARLARYGQYLAFYEGDQWLGSPRPGERRITANYVRALIRKSVSYMFADPPGQEVLPLAGGADGRRIERLLADVAEANELATSDFDAAVQASVLGDGAFKVTWEAAERRPVITPVDVFGLAVWSRGDDPRQMTKLVQRTAMPAEEAVERYGLTLTGAAQRVTVAEEWTDRALVISVANVEVKRGPNPFGWIPYVVWPNVRRPGEFWGESDLIDLVELQREFNRRVSIASHILELSGNPIAVLENIEKADGIVARPGALWELPEGAKAYLLDLLEKGGLTYHLDFIDKLYRTLHDISETPRTAFGDAGPAGLSGVALEVELQPLIQKVKRKRRVWEGVFARRNRMVLDLLRRFGKEAIPDGVRTATVWGAILPTDR